MTPAIGNGQDSSSKSSEPIAPSSSPSSSSPSPKLQTRQHAERAELRILTYNVWGLAFLSKARAQRIPAIAARLAASDYDIVALQEIWCESTDWRALRERCRATFPYAKYFYTGAFGSGLAILSRFPIVATHTSAYSLNGHPVLVHHGDWIVAKATGCATVNLSARGLGLTDVWVTHTVAAGGEDGPESRRSHRITQAYELANHAQHSAEKGRHVICLGDFNCTPPSLSMALLRDVGLLTDAFVQAHPNLPANAVSLPTQNSRIRADPRRSIAELGVTCDSPLNTWTAGKPLDERAIKGAGKRLDYVLFRGPAVSSAEDAASAQGRLRCVESTVVFTELLEDIQLSYSDHFGLEAVFQIQAADSSDKQGGGARLARPTPSSAHSSRISQTLTSSLSALAAALITSRKTQTTHMLAFVAALVLALTAIGCSAIRSAGGAIGALWTLVALLCGWAGTTALYSAVIWGEWEKRTLRTFFEAMELDLLALRRPLTSSDEDVRPPAPANTRKGAAVPLRSHSQDAAMGQYTSENAQLVNIDEE